MPDCDDCANATFKTSRLFNGIAVDTLDQAACICSKSKYIFVRNEEIIDPDTQEPTGATRCMVYKRCLKCCCECNGLDELREVNLKCECVGGDTPAYFFDECEEVVYCISCPPIVFSNNTFTAPTYDVSHTMATRVNVGDEFEITSVFHSFPDTLTNPGFIRFLIPDGEMEFLDDPEITTDVDKTGVVTFVPVDNGELPPNLRVGFQFDVPGVDTGDGEFMVLGDATLTIKYKVRVKSAGADGTAFYTFSHDADEAALLDDAAAHIVRVIITGIECSLKNDIKCGDTFCNVKCGNQVYILTDEGFKKKSKCYNC